MLAKGHRPVLLGALLFVSNAALAMDGAFGLSFHGRIEAELIGAKLIAPPLSEVTLRHVAKAAGSREDSLVSEGWHHFNPDPIPPALRTFAHRGYVELDSQRRAQRIVLLLASPCDTPEHTFLVDALNKKLDLEAQAIETQAPYTQALSWPLGSRSVALFCGTETLVLYSDHRRLSALSAQQRDTTRAQKKVARKLKEQHQRLHQWRMEQLAEEFTLGDRYKLQGLFGVAFDAPYPGWDGHPRHQEFTVNLSQPLPSADFHIMLSEEGQPIKLRGRFQQNNRLNFVSLAEAFATKYGNPMKRGRRHIIHRISERFLVLRQHTDTSIELSMVDSKRQKQMKERDFNREVEGL